MSIGLYLVVVLAIAVSVGLFEVWGINHYRVGWGELLPQDKWWGKNVVPKVLFNVVGPQLLTRYHFFMYFVIVPGLVALLGYAFYDAHRPTNWIGCATFLIAGTMGVMVLEDFLFFVFSSIFGKPYPRALARLFRGEAIWHPNQIKFSEGFVVPATYLWVPAVATILLWIGFRFGS